MVSIRVRVTVIKYRNSRKYGNLICTPIGQHMVILKTCAHFVNSIGRSRIRSK